MGLRLKKPRPVSAMNHARAKLFSAKSRTGICEWSVHVETRPIDRFYHGQTIKNPENVVCLAISQAGKRPFTIALETDDAYELVLDISRAIDQALGI
jgi:hypothetical protein